MTPDVLIPRDDTCALAEIAIRQALFLDQNPRILDLCTGSGCIGIAIASRVKDAKVTLADLSREALAVAKKNVVLHHMTGRVSCVQVDAMAKPPAFLGQFDMIVSNPPYITSAEMETLDPSVRDFEPHLALDGGEDGMRYYRAILAGYLGHLAEDGCIIFEIGYDQKRAIRALAQEYDCTCIIRRDYDGNDRVAVIKPHPKA